MSQGVMRTASEALSCKGAALYGFGNSAPGAQRKTPLLNKLYQTRSKLMHKMVGCALKSFSTTNCSREIEPQLLILGAGLDVSYNSYSSSTFAVDFEPVLKQRASIASASDAILIEGDLEQVDTLLVDLKRSGLNLSVPTVILLECVLSYVDLKSAGRLLSTLASRFSEATLIMYDPALPYSNTSCSGLASMMHQKFNERQAPLLSCAQSAAQYMSNLRTAGWLHVSAMSVNQASQLFLSAAERNAGTLSEPFDEFASLALLQNYYAVGIASTQRDAFRRTHELLYASKTCDSERAQAVKDRMALAEMRLLDIVSHIEQRNIVAPQQIQCNRNVVVRKARVNDTHTLVQVYQSAFASPAEKYTSVKKYVKFSLKALKEFEKTYSAERSVLFVAEVQAWDEAKGELGEAAVAGCLGVKVKQLPTEGGVGLAELSHFCVSHRLQRSGVGRALLAQAVDYCREVLGGARSSAICLTVLRDLEAARRLYASQGFEHVSTEKLGNDCELYNLRLNLDVVD